MTAPHADSALYDVGYGKPPRHTQFRKGQSGNPGGRPRREPVERLKALTLEEAYRGVVIKREDGVGMPAFAIQAILRSQIELAINGNVRAQRDILNAVRAYERADAEAAALDAYVEELVRQAADLEEALKAGEETKRAAPVEKKMSYVDAARRITFLLGLNKSAVKSEAAKSETCASGKGSVTEERDEERNAVALAPSADSVPQPENDAVPASSPVASPPPLSAEPPAAPPVDPRPWRSRPNRSARRRTSDATPSRGEVVRAGRLHNRVLRNRRLRHGTGNSAQPFNVTWKEITSLHSRRQKSGNSLLNSLFSGNVPAVRAGGARRQQERAD
jgi:hypothetical protein